jgi:hypothetical protein
MVQRLEADRKTNLGLAYCENRKKIKEGEWGPMLVERQRRKKNDGEPCYKRLWS